MGCLIASVTMGNRPTASVTMGNRPTAKVTMVDGLTAKVNAGDRLAAKVNVQRQSITVRIGIVCSMPEELVIRFAKDKLVWEGETNNDGVILYNTLISTGDWSLEEIHIEELL